MFENLSIAKVQSFAASAGWCIFTVLWISQP